MCFVCTTLLWFQSKPRICTSRSPVGCRSGGRLEKVNNIHFPDSFTSVSEIRVWCPEDGGRVRRWRASVASVAHLAHVQHCNIEKHFGGVLTRRRRRSRLRPYLINFRKLPFFWSADHNFFFWLFGSVADGWWPEKRIQKCRNECTYIQTRPLPGSSGCRKWFPFIS